jgi:hypothetical protein
MALRRVAMKAMGEQGVNLSVFDHPKEFLERQDLCDFLTVTQWEDGTPRETGTLSLYMQNGRLGVCITDKAQGRMAFITISLQGSILDEIDHALGDEDLVWKPYKASSRKGK